MLRIALIAALSFGLTPGSFSQGQRQQDAARDACIQRCVSQPQDEEVQRQEIISLEREAARAIQLNSSTFFHRVYSDEFAGTLSHGQQVNKQEWIAAVESPLVKRDSFNASEIKVRIYEDTAVASCLWSSRFSLNGQHLSSQMRAIHVYINTPYGWHVVSGQTTNLPPDVQQPL
jgi:hypothetical protein